MRWLGRGGVALAALLYLSTAAWAGGMACFSLAGGVGQGVPYQHPGDGNVDGGYAGQSLTANPSPQGSGTTLRSSIYQDYTLNFPVGALNGTLNVVMDAVNPTDVDVSKNTCMRVQMEVISGLTTGRVNDMSQATSAVATAAILGTGTHEHLYFLFGNIRPNTQNGTPCGPSTCNAQLLKLRVSRTDSSNAGLDSLNPTCNPGSSAINDNIAILTMCVAWN